MTKKDLDFVILPLVNPSFDRATIDLDQIRHLSSQSLDGYPPEDRALAWLSLLGIYPSNPLEWSATYKQHESDYFQFVRDNHLHEWHLRPIPPQIPLEEYRVDDNALMALVHGDIVRTGRTIFFLPPLRIPAEDPDSQDSMAPFGEHARRLERILYIYGRLNRTMAYMQGFNELIVPFYYVLLSAKSILNNSMDLVEALAFQCLMTLLNGSTLNEFYTTTDASSMIMRQLEEFKGVVGKHLPEVAGIINGLDIHPLLYSFRWFNLLFSQEHDLPDLLAIWDDLLSQFDPNDVPKLMKFVFYVALGHLNCIKGRLKRGDYGVTLFELQNLSGLDIKGILQFANGCWMKDHPPERRFDPKKLLSFFTS